MKILRRLLLLSGCVLMLARPDHVEAQYVPIHPGAGDPLPARIVGAPDAVSPRPARSVLERSPGYGSGRIVGPGQPGPVIGAEWSTAPYAVDAGARTAARGQLPWPGWGTVIGTAAGAGVGSFYAYQLGAKGRDVPAMIVAGIVTGAVAGYLVDVTIEIF